MTSIAALVPIRGRVNGKSRLADRFEPWERRVLIESMARHVVSTLMRSEVVTRVMVISKDIDFIDDVLPDISGVSLVHQPDSVPGLNAGIGLGREWAIMRGVSRLLLISGDLPLLTVDDVRELSRQSSPVVLAPDWTGRGTNGVLLNQRRSPRTSRGTTDDKNLIAEFTFRFGHDSLRKHEMEAARMGAASETVLGRGTRYDLDTPDDWTHLDPLTRERLLPHDRCGERSSPHVPRPDVCLGMVEHS